MNRSTENGKRFYLVLCELHCMEIHGKNEDSDKYIDTHYILCDRFNPQTGIAYSNFDDYDDEDNIDFVSENADDNNNYFFPFITYCSPFSLYKFNPYCFYNSNSFLRRKCNTLS